jgi:hypothetical protein
MVKNVSDVELASKINNEDGVLTNVRRQDLVFLLSAQFVKKHTNENFLQDIVPMNAGKLKQSLELESKNF